jgi:membrane-bound serine protease (ClpP class)
MMPVVTRWLAAIGSAALIPALLAALLAGAQAAPGERVLVVEIKGAISVAAQRQVSRVIDQARRDNAAAIVIRLDTPGGLVSATRDIIRDMVASPIPIIVYVAPSGARAASAGTFLVYASHLAAMAPGTNLGAATPVQMGGIPGVPQPKDDKKPAEPSAAEKKSINDVIALLRSLAQMRGRDLDFAEKAVRDAATLTATEARAQGVIEIVASNVPDVLAQADGRRVMVAGADRTLSTRDAEIVNVAPDWRTQLLGIIADPNVAFILLLIGIYGLLFEFWTPGAIIPGVLGSICLLLALIALSVLPVQYGALGLLLLGIALMIGEAFTPGIGALGIGGLVAFVVGSFYLFETDAADFDFRVSLSVIAGAAIVSAGFAFLVVGAAVKARNRPVTLGLDDMLGIRGAVIDWQGEQGHVRVNGEIWNARGSHAFGNGDIVRVRQRKGLTLFVEPE